MRDTRVPKRLPIGRGDGGLIAHRQRGQQSSGLGICDAQQHLIAPALAPAIPHRSQRNRPPEALRNRPSASRTHGAQGAPTLAEHPAFRIKTPWIGQSMHPPQPHRQAPALTRLHPRRRQGGQPFPWGGGGPVQPHPFGQRHRLRPFDIPALFDAPGETHPIRPRTRQPLDLTRHPQGAILQRRVELLGQAFPGTPTCLSGSEQPPRQCQADGRTHAWGHGQTHHPQPYSTADHGEIGPRRPECRLHHLPGRAQQHRQGRTTVAHAGRRTPHRASLGSHGGAAWGVASRAILFLHDPVAACHEHCC